MTQTPPSKRILVTSALPYANGSIHLGHLVEYIQTDIWVRFMKQRGHTVHYVCADDTHGTPVMLRAEKEGVSPETLIARMHHEHLSDFQGFGVNFDHYGSTHSEETRQWAYTVYRRLKEKGLICSRSIEQFYDPVKAMFLPDRFIKGECPRCGAQDQYGDSCEKCGAVYSPQELKNPVSAVSGAVPELRHSEHYFFQLGACADVLKKWLAQEGRVPQESKHKLEEWFKTGLQDWDISRDSPYFGFEIPDHPGKYFYVWLDAPIGYMGAFQQLCEREQIDFSDYWKADSNTELVHFIGKDILYFHALFWPAMLNAANFRTPTRLCVHGFLTINGEKMSKSRGTFITARSYLDAALDPEWLRFYYASKMSSAVEDIDLNLDDFSAKINSTLVGKLVNIPSRVAGFIHKKFEGRIAALSTLSDPLLETVNTLLPSVAELFEQREFAKGTRLIEQGLDAINQYVDTKSPWLLAKQADEAEHLHAVCSITLEALRRILIPLAPILPQLVARAETFLNIPAQNWSDITRPLPDHHTLNPYHHLMQRVDAKQLNTLVAAPAQPVATPTKVASSPAKSQTTEAEKSGQSLITIDQFGAVELRVVQIMQAEAVEGAAKLLKVTVDIGNNVTKTVFAGIKSAYTPESLVGRLTVMVVNLQPRKMKFGLSEGMLLAASDETGQHAGLFLLSPDSGAKAGMLIK